MSTIWKVDIDGKATWVISAAQAARLVGERMRQPPPVAAVIDMREYERPTTAADLCAMLNGDLAPFEVKPEAPDSTPHLFPPHEERLHGLDGGK